VHQPSAVEDDETEPALHHYRVSGMPKTVNGLPVHPLLVHVTVTVLPLAALLVLLAGVWPGARRRLSVAPLILAVVALILLPLTYKSGNNLRAMVGTSPAIRRHVHLAHQLLFPVLGLVLAAIVVEIVRRRSARVTIERRRDSGSLVLSVIAAILAVVFSVGTAVQTVRVGEAGARAVWGHTAGNQVVNR